MAAKRKPKEPEEGAVTEPLIEYFGEGAEQVQFNINPRPSDTECSLMAAFSKTFNGKHRNRIPEPVCPRGA